jgi:hypothetical protein
MNESSSKSFDCVQSMREARDRLSAEIADMSYGELTHWLRTHRYSDPILQRLAEKADQGADAANRPSGDR